MFKKVYIILVRNVDWYWKLVTTRERIWNIWANTATSKVKNSFTITDIYKTLLTDLMVLVFYLALVFGIQKKYSFLSKAYPFYSYEIWSTERESLKNSKKKVTFNLHIEEYTAKIDGDSKFVPYKSTELN